MDYNLKIKFKEVSYEINLFNSDTHAYEVLIDESTILSLRIDHEERLQNGIIVTPERHVVSGTVVDALAKYENTDLTPNEIKELSDTLKELKGYNRILKIQSEI